MSETNLSEFLAAQGYIGIQMQKNAIGHFEVQARVNGIQSRLLVDTGASRSIIGRDSAARLNLAITESDIKAGGVGTSEHAVAYGVIESLEFQSFRVAELQVGVIDLSHINHSLEAHGASRIEGAIGGDLMSSREAIIDYRQAVLYLRFRETNLV
jgi:clan AA aspartic protease (TIGR02281 family)